MFNNELREVITTLRQMNVEMSIRHDDYPCECVKVRFTKWIGDTPYHREFCLSEYEMDMITCSVEHVLLMYLNKFNIDLLNIKENMKSR